MTHLFYGDNTFAARERMQQMVAEFVDEYDTNGLERIDGGEAKAERIISSITTLPFLQPKRLIIVEEVSQNKEVAEKVLEVLDRIPEDNTVVFYEPNIDKRTKVYKQLKKQCQAEEFSELSRSQLKKWLSQLAERYGADINSKTANYLIEVVGTNQWRLKHELIKLANYQAEITTDTVDEVAHGTFENTIFDLTDQLAGGNLQKALKLYRGLLDNNEDPRYILLMIAWHLRNLLALKAAGGKSPNTVAQETGISQFVAKKTRPQADNISFAALKQAHHQTAELDYQLKTQSMDADQAIEWLLNNLITTLSEEKSKV